MRFIPTKAHAPLDYVVGAALIAAPWIFQFSEHTAATIVPIVLGIGLIAYSLFTNYELGLWKIAPMAVHNLIDIAAGSLLAASPWIFGFADDSANVWMPHLIVGIAAVFLGLATKQPGGALVLSAQVQVTEEAAVALLRQGCSPDLTLRLLFRAS